MEAEGRQFDEGEGGACHRRVAGERKSTGGLTMQEALEAISVRKADKATDDTVEIGVQVNGKLRGKISGPADMNQEQAEALARAEDNVSRHLADKALRRVIFVPGRLLNFVVG